MSDKLSDVVEEINKYGLRAISGFRSFAAQDDSFLNWQFLAANLDDFEISQIKGKAKRYGYHVSVGIRVAKSSAPLLAVTLSFLKS